ncbi:hypothetical protein MAR_023168 [Mya arenaria]|uniref:Uncharacterized protein n=1 Tax=Mya arenaria TaxID=6604 RepID=A0ABY7DV33_MYAAR|nr:hypothetical protein MAR_023168 [Mya arenaria]
MSSLEATPSKKKQCNVITVSEPRLRSFTDVGDVIDTARLSCSEKDHCAKILTDLNEETARYCILASLLGTRTDCDLLRRKLKMARLRMWDHAKQAQIKLIPVLKRSRSGLNEDLERMYRAFSACLEYLEEQYFTTLLVQAEFTIQSELDVLIHAGMSENPLSKKQHDKLVVDRLPGTDILSVKSFGSGDVLSTGVDENLQRYETARSLIVLV